MTDAKTSYLEKHVVEILNLQELGITIFIQLTVYALLAGPKKNVSRSPPSFWRKEFVAMFLHYSFQFGGRQRSQKLIVHWILDIYSHISLLLRAVNCSETACVMWHIECNFGPVLTAINKVSGRIVYIVDHILISSNPRLYYMLCLTLSFRFPPGFHERIL